MSSKPRRASQVRIWMQIGDRPAIEVAAAVLNNEATATTDIANLLRAVADEFERQIPTALIRRTP